MRTLEERFWAKVNKEGPLPSARPDLGKCWLWTGAMFRDGYGNFRVDRASNRGAHRVGYQLQVGPVPDGLEIDHLCVNRGCVNALHLEPVTKRINVLRGTGPSARCAVVTHCPQGHPYDDANTYLWRGARHCRICVASRKKAST